MKNLNEIVFMIFLILVISCSADDEETMEIIVEDDPIGANLERLNYTELDYITKLLIVDEEIQLLWNDFMAVREYPIFILTDTNQGVFINPPTSQMPNSREIAKEIDDFENFDLYRNDTILEFAKSRLTGQQFFSYEEYDDFELYLYDISKEPPIGFYGEYKNRNGHFHVSIFYHELFHFYQIQNWELYYGDNFIVNYWGFPLTEDTLPMLILLFDVMIDAYHQNNTFQKTKYLEYYVAIMYKLNEIDPSPNGLIRSQAFYLEKSEGAARYIEVFATLNSLDNNTIDDPTHGYKAFADNLSNSIDVRQVYSRRIFYHSGAGVINLLSELGYQNMDDAFLIPTNTPYDIAAGFLNLSDIERNTAFEEVKDLYDWEAIVSRAEYLLSF